MSAILENELGAITFTDDYIASLVGMAATDCYGVVGMASQQKMADGIAELLGRDNYKRGVKIETNSDHSIKIQLFIIVQYGISIVAIVDSIISTVKYQVENFTGLTVSNVDVVVSGIRVQAD